MLQDLDQKIQHSFHVHHITLEDQAYFHRGHHPDRQGGHYALTLVSDDFKTLSTIARHQAVYKALNMPQNKTIHALSLNTFTVDEWLAAAPKKDQ